MLEKPREEEKEAAFGRKEMETKVTRETILREDKHLHTHWGLTASIQHERDILEVWTAIKLGLPLKSP